MTDAHFPADCLRQRVYSLTGGTKKSISESDIQALRLDHSVVTDICSCLKSNDVSTLSTGFFFLDSLLKKNSGKDFGEEFFIFLVKRVRELLSHDSDFVCSKALEAFIWLRTNYSDYREIMLRCLASSNLALRCLALNSFDTYSVVGEISPLVRFYSDDYAAEYSMLGPIRYELRDLALEKIEAIAKIKFRVTELTEPYDCRTVKWYNWEPFQKWWIENKSKFN